MHIDELNYELPKELIAQEPIEERDQSRLLVVDSKTGKIEHKRFLDIAEYVHSGDLFVFNDTKVVATRLYGRKLTGGAIEALLISKIDGEHWRALVKPGRRVQIGTPIIFGDGRLTATAIERTADGERILEFRCDGDCDELISELGEVPLPPHICNKIEDYERYQTIYARQMGSAAAPTAGLHFTPRVFSALEGKGVDSVFITLHIGIWTFRPIRVENILEHEMYAESILINDEAAEKINSCTGRIIAVGTSTARALESAAVGHQKVRPMCEETRLFITPGYEFKVVDALLTNFHMPRSTLIALVSALAGRDLIMKAYSEAVREHYRFLSFGDAMFIH